VGDVVRSRVQVGGVVQGVGFRPFAWRRATRLGLRGWVENGPDGAVIEVQGAAAAVTAFLDGLAAAAPPLARVARVVAERVPVVPRAAGFAILASAAPGRPATAVPADVAPCASCLAEIADPANRRHGHPFVTCTDCGPRYTIIERLPYDRAATTMRAFPPCPRCTAEYADPADRRFHAQPICCPDCGPIAWFTPAGPDAAASRDAARVTGAAAIAAARGILRGGGILAVKGVGGFHLSCDATDEAAVNRLRARKRRGGKPLAIAVADVAAARPFAVIDEQERRLLEGPERPIVLLRKGSPACRVAVAVAPGNDFLGVMLPSSPLQQLLCAGMPPLVMTSGNLSEEPIEHDEHAAVRRLAGLADGFLAHDRGIHVPCDDSVVRCVAGAAVPIRRGRGHAPLPLPLGAAGPSVLAVGGELKAAVCVTRGAEAFLGQHLGDAENLETIQAVERSADHLMGLLGVEPVAVAADLHPGQVSAAWARRYAAARGIPFIPVQHHEAHVAALLAERQAADFSRAAGFIGVCFDGTGYGRDGTIQGGEFYVVAAGSLRRAAHLEPFPLPGGDASIRRPWRTALAVLHAAGIPWDERLPAVRAGGAEERRVLARQLAAGTGCVASTSMGRLFDAVASLAGVKHAIAYEAEAALNLEALAGAADREAGAYAFTVSGGDPLRIGWRSVVAEVVEDVAAGCGPAVIAARFHAGVADMIAAVCRRLRTTAGGDVAGLTGGVFQNAVLTERAIASLGREGFEVVVHHAVPPNDGGLALGQAVIARGLLRGPAEAAPVEPARGPVPRRPRRCSPGGPD
jgi:hydrogenase maturation protein HypF